MPDDARELLTAIKEMADARKAEVRDQAEREMTRISERVEAQVKQLRDEALARLEDQLRTESECMMGRMELEIRDRLISRKNEALGEVFERAGRQIDELNGTETYRDIFKRLAWEAVRRMNCKDMRLRISEVDLPLWETLKEDFPESISVVSCDSPRGIVVVETNDGSQSIDNSIETRLEKAREVMGRELIEILFDAGTSEEKIV